MSEDNDAIRECVREILGFNAGRLFQYKWYGDLLDAFTAEIGRREQRAASEIASLRSRVDRLLEMLDEQRAETEKWKQTWTATYQSEGMFKGTLARLIDNVESGGYESTNQAIAEARAALTPSLFYRDEDMTAEEIADKVYRRGDPNWVFLEEAIESALVAARQEARREAGESVHGFDCLPAVNEAMQWTDPPPYDERWINAVCKAAELVRNQIAEALSRSLPPPGSGGEQT